MSLYAQAVRFAIANTETIIQKAHDLMAFANQKTGDDPETTAYYVSLELKDNHFETVVRMNQERAFVYDYNVINIDYTTQTAIADDPDYAIQLKDALERALETIETCDKAADAMTKP
jgi:hypothetical protein